MTVILESIRNLDYSDPDYGPDMLQCWDVATYHCLEANSLEFLYINIFLKCVFSGQLLLTTINFTVFCNS